MIWLIWLQQRFSKEATEANFEAKEADLECQQDPYSQGYGFSSSHTDVRVGT